MSEVKRTERGWAGHFCAADECRFKRNTLLEFDGTKVVVSTVGRWVPPTEKKIERVGWGRYYETMAFIAKKNDKYDDANIDCEVDLMDVDTYIDKPSADIEANEMHENAVSFVSERLKEYHLGVYTKDYEKKIYV